MRTLTFTDDERRQIMAASNPEAVRIALIKNRLSPQSFAAWLRWNKDDKARPASAYGHTIHYATTAPWTYWVQVVSPLGEKLPETECPHFSSVGAARVALYRGKIPNLPVTYRRRKARVRRSSRGAPLKGNVSVLLRLHPATADRLRRAAASRSQTPGEFQALLLDVFDLAPSFLK